MLPSTPELVGKCGSGILKETKVTKGIYTQKYSDYMVMALEAPSAHISGITVFYCAAEHFSVEAPQIFGANIVSFQLDSGSQRWYVVGCYLAPYKASTIEDLHVHQSASLGDWVASGQQFQHQIGSARGPIKGRADCGSDGHIRS